MILNRLYILGKGIQVVFPILAFSVGDDPAHGGTVKKEMKRPLLQVERDAIASFNDRGKTYTLINNIGSSYTK